MRTSPARITLSILSLAIAAAAVAWAPLPLSTALLSWSVVYGNGDIKWHTQQAADSTEGGFTDWRLPTIAEFTAGVNDGSIAPLVPSANISYWTSKRQGSWGYAAKVQTDANGVPNPATLQINKVWWQSGFGAKYVRP